MELRVIRWIGGEYQYLGRYGTEASRNDPARKRAATRRMRLFKELHVAVECSFGASHRHLSEQQLDVEVPSSEMWNLRELDFANPTSWIQLRRVHHDGGRRSD